MVDSRDAADGSNRAVYRERLEQALRVMEGLSQNEREHQFDMEVFARQTPHGIVACIAGHCGLDPWFQEQGLITRPDGFIGSISVQPGDFFGIARPFIASHLWDDGDYNPWRGDRITYEAAVEALCDAIAEFAEPVTDA